MKHTWNLFYRQPSKHLFNSNKFEDLVDWHLMTLFVFARSRIQWISFVRSLTLECKYALIIESKQLITQTTWRRKTKTKKCFLHSKSHSSKDNAGILFKWCIEHKSIHIMRMYVSYTYRNNIIITQPVIIKALVQSSKSTWMTLRCLKSFMYSKFFFSLVWAFLLIR